ncbi:MAG: hypothetical protein WA840_11530 [Caulobacteraceae bacterium]
MYRKLLLGSVLAVALPAAAMAQPPDPSCVRSNEDSRAQGTILGGIGGALIGGAIGHGAGALIGGLTGAVAGNAIAGSRNDPCPPGFYYAPPPGYAGYGPPPPPPPPAAGFWRDAPGDIRQRIDYLNDRVSRAEGDGRIDHRQADDARAELDSVRASVRNLWQRDGGLNPADRDYIQARLNYIADRLHWMERAG